MLEASGVRMLYIEVEGKTLINGMDLKRNAALNISTHQPNSNKGTESEVRFESGLFITPFRSSDTRKSNTSLAFLGWV